MPGFLCILQLLSGTLTHNNVELNNIHSNALYVYYLHTVSPVKCFSSIGEDFGDLFFFYTVAHANFLC